MSVRTAFVVVSLVALASPVAVARGSGWKVPSVAGDAPEALSSAIAIADRLYDTRGTGDDQGGAALYALRKAAQAHPESWDVQWRLARAAFWVSEGLPEDAKEERRAITTEGWKAGEKAQELKPDAPEGPYFMALCIGEYSHTVGLFAALKQGLEAKFREPLLAVAQKSPNVDHGGVWNALGRYKFELPWPKRDLDESISYLRKGLEVNPDNLRARVYLAESLEKRGKGDDVAEAKKLIERVAQAPTDKYDPAEERRAKSLAKAFSQRLKWQIEGL